VRAEAPEVPVVVDLQGAKMRVGDFPRHSVARGDRVRFVPSRGGPDDVPLPHRELFDEVRVGEVLSCDDDRLRCEVERAGDGVLVARWLTDGVLAPRKGINRASHPVEPSSMSDRDRAQVDAAQRFVNVAFAWSFMSDGREAAWVRARAPGCPVIAKVERPEAVLAIDRVLSSTDATWICRGDLGAQLGARRLAEFVTRWRPPASGPPVLMAGQVLHHLTAQADVTRSEVCHLFDVLARGYAGIVLSDETAVGAAPLEAVKTARRLLDELG
jgi:pyruvate kinase